MQNYTKYTIEIENLNHSIQVRSSRSFGSHPTKYSKDKKKDHRFEDGQDCCLNVQPNVTIVIRGLKKDKTVDQKFWSNVTIVIKGLNKGKTVVKKVWPKVTIVIRGLKIDKTVVQKVWPNVTIVI